MGNKKKFQILENIDSYEDEAKQREIISKVFDSFEDADQMILFLVEFILFSKQTNEWITLHIINRDFIRYLKSMTYSDEEENQLFQKLGNISSIFRNLQFNTIVY